VKSRLLEMAKEAADAARVLRASGNMRGMVNRAYYAMFYYASAWLAMNEDAAASAKQHKSVIAAFAKQALNNPDLGRDLGRMLAVAFDMRLGADYGEMPDPDAEKIVFEYLEAFERDWHPQSRSTIDDTVHKKVLPATALSGGPCDKASADRE
jgi:uncharacterized protein (UPF0332 family)